jgi:protein subunit release factor A
MLLKEEDLKYDWYRQSPRVVSGHSNCVRITHLPTGLVASCDEYRSLFKNKLEALKRLQALVCGITS